MLNAGTNPPRRCATVVAAVKASQALTASDGGDFQRVERPLVFVIPAKRSASRNPVVWGTTIWIAAPASDLPPVQRQDAAATLAKVQG